MADSPLPYLALLWVAYAVLHSVLASFGIKGIVQRRYPRYFPAYRLFFNVVAIVTLLPVLYGVASWPGPTLWAWQGAWGWLADGLALAAIFGVLWTLRFYQGMDFIGLSQWHQGQQQLEDQEQFSLSPLHRFVRHPWYSLGLVVVWTRDMDAAWLLSAVFITAYFVLGSRLEEAKLVRYHGALYQAYQRQVPGLIPRPWRYLSQEAAARLLASAATASRPHNSG